MTSKVLCILVFIILSIIFENKSVAFLVICLKLHYRHIRDTHAHFFATKTTFQSVSNVFEYTCILIGFTYLDHTNFLSVYSLAKIFA